MSIPLSIVSHCCNAQRSCECLDGFTNYTEPVGCQLIDLCATDSNKCDVNADCTMFGPSDMRYTIIGLIPSIISINFVYIYCV